MRASLLRMLNELDLDLHDMGETVEIASKDPARFNLDQPELKHRRDFVQTSQGQAAELRAELTETSDRLSAAGHKERTERHGLLSGGAAAAEAASSNGPSAKQRAVGQLNEEAIQQQQAIQLAVVEQQDEQLGVLSGVMDRLGAMGRTINEELRAQGKALDEFTQEVDETHGKMNAALTVMNKMLKSKDRGKFCAIIVLTLVLFVLIFLVFS